MILLPLITASPSMFCCDAEPESSLVSGMC
jgi:hypothetical protein